MPTKLNNLKYVDINGKIKTFNSELVVNQSFINENINYDKFEASFTFFLKIIHLHCFYMKILMKDFGLKKLLFHISLALIVNSQKLITQQYLITENKKKQ